MRLVIFCTLLFVLSVITFTRGHKIPFPKDFVFGTATAAYQIEGAAKEDGRGPSIWDEFSHTPGKTFQGATGDVACDHYHRLEEDVKLMVDMGIKYYRMSISWSRLLPNGTIDNINQRGIDHYNKEIDILVKNGIKPFVTLYHWDLPLNLHKKYGGWLNKDASMKHFGDYADLCFKSFGDRVKNWITFNEAWCSSVLGYLNGVHAPGRCTNCKPEQGDSIKEPYLAAHSIILSHAVAVETYKKRYQQSQGGFIGMTMNSDWGEPLTDKPEDQDASERMMEFQLGWFADPIFKGDYPPVMRRQAGSLLPTFTYSEKQLLLRAKSDFFGLNHYSTAYVSARSSVSNDNDYFAHMNVSTTHEKDGKPIGVMADSPWLYVVPWGARRIVNWVYNRYRIKIYVTENGCDVPNEDKLPFDQAINDTFRVSYLHGYLNAISEAIQQDNVPVAGYFVWSFMDNYEWADGYAKRFGIHYVDYAKNNTRTAKASAKWYAELIKQ
ncbi:beta-glucosidase [Acrasis kona]|uniref:Beta-glucosidase n=1 Tax=Acrasis kona TaxID=1008807 RepID=A0AAW2ZIM5_9EUKA